MVKENFKVDYIRINKSIYIYQLLLLQTLSVERKWIIVCGKLITQVTFPCSNSALKTLERRVKYIQT